MARTLQIELTKEEVKFLHWVSIYVLGNRHLLFKKSGRYYVNAALIEEFQANQEDFNCKGKQIFRSICQKMHESF